MCEGTNDDHRIEPQKGLPQKLPEGEKLLWQGAPSMRALAIDAFHVRALAVYFGIAAILRGSYLTANGSTAREGLETGLVVFGMGGVSVAILAIIAWGMASRCMITITSKRIVVRHGVAIRKYINIPFGQIAEIGLRVHQSGKGDIALTTDGTVPLPYLHLWPFVRPTHFRKTAPVLRGLTEVQTVADTLVRAMKEHSPATVNLTAQQQANENRGSIQSAALAAEV